MATRASKPKSTSTKAATAKTKTSKTKTSKVSAPKAAPKATAAKSAKPKSAATKTRAPASKTAAKTTAPKKAATPAPKPATAAATAPATPAATVSKLEPVVSGPSYRKKELLDAVARKTGMKRADVKKVVEATLFEMGLALQDSRDLNLQPFGTVKINRERKLPDGRVMVAKIRQARDLSAPDDAAPATIKLPQTKTAAE